MAWFVYILFATLCLAIVSSLSVVVAVRYALLERFVTILLRKGLRRVSNVDEDGAAYTVERTAEGITAA